jgi:hypothetical protein
MYLSCIGVRNRSYLSLADETHHPLPLHTLSFDVAPIGGLGELPFKIQRYVICFVV